MSKNLVVCCDGTGNEIGIKLSNVLKLYRIAGKNESQLVYYGPGIGTIDTPSSWERRRQKAKSLFGMVTGWGLDRDVLDAYRFLCTHYEPGDDIYLIGFSRGAYTVRVLAGFLHLVGLLKPHQVNFAGYALGAYKRASEANDHEIAWTFRRVVNGLFAPIRFLGVWDTVASMIVPGARTPTSFSLEVLPFTNQNPSVKTFRHAMAIDEFRRMFRLHRWEEPQDYKPNPFAATKIPIVQDSKQVWFAGCHSDVGGGYIEEESGLSKFPLLWMLEEAKAHGLKTNTAMINHMVRGQPREGARLYAKPDPEGLLHISMTKGWKCAEWLPKPASLREWPSRPVLLGHYIPWSEPRAIPDGALIHSSVVARKAKVAGYNPVNLPQNYSVVP